MDIGDQRIGVAVASVIAKLPQPLNMLFAGGLEAGTTTGLVVEQIQEVIKAQQITMVVVGLPRNMQGEETMQSVKIRRFAEVLGAMIDVPLVFADESLSSARADEIMKQGTFKNASQDSLAACFILEEFLSTIDSAS